MELTRGFENCTSQRLRSTNEARALNDPLYPHRHRRHPPTPPQLFYNSGVLRRLTTRLTLPLTVLVNRQPQCSTQKVTYDGKLNKLIRSTPTIPRTILSCPLTLCLFALTRGTPPTRVQSSSQSLVGLCLHSLYTVSRCPPVLHRRLVLHTPGGSPRGNNNKIRNVPLPITPRYLPLSCLGLCNSAPAHLSLSYILVTLNHQSRPRLSSPT